MATQLHEQLNLAIIFTEEKSKKIEDSSEYVSEDQQLLDTHFQDRAVAEESFFGDYKQFPRDVPHIAMAFGKINSPETLAHLNTHSIDGILLFGTSIIKAIILEKYPNKVINLHLGLSPYYKGSGTNFFPIVNNEFECIGATIHLATNKVDAGGILHQIRLEELYEDDSIHTIGNRLIQKAGLEYPTIANEFLSGNLQPVPQKEVAHSKEYRIKDFTPDMIRKAHKVLANRGIMLYLEQSHSRKQNKPIITASDA